MIHSMEETADEAQTSARGAVRGFAVRIAALVLAAVLANLVILGIAAFVGVTLRAQTMPAPPPMTVGAVAVVASTTLPLAAGTIVVVLLRRRSWMLLMLAWLGAGVALVSIAMPATAALDAGTGVALAAMHLVVGVTWLAIVRTVRR